MILIITTHPIQYQVPLWKKIANTNIEVEVIFLTKHGLDLSYDEEFDTSFKWDIDLLKGYKYGFAQVNEKPNVNSFLGVKLKQSLKSIINNRRVDAIWIQGWQVLAYWQIVLEARLLGIPIWIRAETNDIKPRTSIKRLINYLPFRLFFSSISKFLYIGEANKRFYLKWGVNDKQLSFTPYCVDVDWFKNEIKDLSNTRNSLRKELNISEDSFCFLFCGKFIPKKNPEIIIEAAKKIKDKKVHILYVGDGKLRSILLENVKVNYTPHSFNYKEKSNNLSDDKVSASFTGFINQSAISKFYLAADCLILPSDYGETWGLVVNEAYACNLPAIVSNQCGSAEDLVEPIDKHLIFEYGDVDQLSLAMNRVILHQEKYSQEIENINNVYHYNTIVNQLLSIKNSG